LPLRPPRANRRSVHGRGHGRLVELVLGGAVAVVPVAGVGLAVEDKRARSGPSCVTGSPPARMVGEVHLILEDLKNHGHKGFIVHTGPGSQLSLAVNLFVDIIQQS
jgi:hypothetical protein